MTLKSFPETHGNGSAKRAEIERVKREQERQRRNFEKAQQKLKDLEGKTAMNANSARGSMLLSAQQLDALHLLVDGDKFDGAVTWLMGLIGTPWVSRKREPRGWASNAIQSWLDPKQSHFSTTIELIAYFIANCGKPHAPAMPDVTPAPIEVTKVNTVYVDSPDSEPGSGVHEAAEPDPCTVDAQPRPPSSEQTGIVRRVEVEGIMVPWILPTLTREGAQLARVSLTDASILLGYQDKRDLKRLAERHVEEIAQFGTMGTVPVVVQRDGRGSITVHEPTYNCDQFVILGLSSQTEMGKRIRIWLLKSFNKLLSEFEQVVQSHIQSTAIDQRLLDTMHEQAKTIRASVERDLLREQNEAERLKAQAGWAERKPRTKALAQNPDQIDFVVEQEALEIHSKAQKVTSLRQKRATTELDRDTAGSSVYRELRGELAKLGLAVPIDSDEKQNHYIARNGWTVQAVAILATIYSKEKSIAADLKRAESQK